MLTKLLKWWLSSAEIFQNSLVGGRLQNCFAKYGKIVRFWIHPIAVKGQEFLDFLIAHLVPDDSPMTELSYACAGSSGHWVACLTHCAFITISKTVEKTFHSIQNYLKLIQQYKYGNNFLPSLVYICLGIWNMGLVNQLINKQESWGKEH